MARSRLSSSVAKPMTPVGTSTETSAPSFASERAAVQQALDSFCARWLGDIAPLTAEAIRYSLLGEGKRLRAILLMEAYRACGGTGDARDLAAAVEVVHAYSLVHDDLPCMDDDDVRRGRPTVHRVYGVPVATAAGLAGDETLHRVDRFVVGGTPAGRTGTGAGKILILQADDPEEHIGGFTGGGEGGFDAFMRPERIERIGAMIEHGDRRHRTIRRKQAEDLGGRGGEVGGVETRISLVVGLEHAQDRVDVAA